MKKLFENKDFKNQIMLPFQGANGLAILSAQGDAIGLIYATQGDAIGLRYAAPSGRKTQIFIQIIHNQMNGRLRSALKGQHNPAQWQRLGRKWNIFYSINQLINQSINWIRAIYPSPTATPWVINNE